MDIDKFGIEQVEVKNECNDSSEAFQIDAVKSEPSEIYSFTKFKSHFNSSSCETDFVDHEFAIANYQDQYEEKLDVKNLNLKDLNHSELPENVFTSYSVNIKKEDIDIFYEDIKRENGNRFCKVCNQSLYGDTDSFKSTRQCSCQKLNESLSYSVHGEDVVPDVKPSNVDLITGVGSQPLEVQDEIISGDEGIEDHDPSALRRRSVSPLGNDDKIKCKTFSCQTCGRQYKYKAGVNQHRRYECLKEASFSCGKCPFITKTKSNLTRHLVYQHSRNKS